MLSDTYGSVREQVEFFEDKMKYFVDAQNMKERMDSINNILKQENINKIQKLQNALSIGGLTFSILFGLPAINETLQLIRKIFGFIKFDVPILSVNNASLVLWVIINGILSYYILSRKNRQ